MKTFTVSFCLISQIRFEFISCGCPNKASQTGSLNNANLLSHSLEPRRLRSGCRQVGPFKAVSVNLLQAVLQLPVLLVILVIP